MAEELNSTQENIMRPEEQKDYQNKPPGNQQLIEQLTIQKKVRAIQLQETEQVGLF